MISAITSILKYLDTLSHMVVQQSYLLGEVLNAQIDGRDQLV